MSGNSDKVKYRWLRSDALEPPCVKTETSKKHIAAFDDVNLHHERTGRAFTQSHDLIWYCDCRSSFDEQW